MDKEVSEYKPITDELRAWAKEHLSRSTILAIADRIDAEHERQLGVLYRDMSDAEWVRLPKDADGKPVRIGDVMEWPTTGETFEVVGIGDGVLFYVDDGQELADWTGASTKRHHHPDTWESIIEDVRRRTSDYYCNNIPCNFREMAEEMVARCKALCERTKEAGE